MMQDTQDSKMLDALLQRINASQEDLAELIHLWRGRREAGFGWVEAHEFYAALARAFVAVGAPLHAAEVSGEGLEVLGEDAALLRAHGLALARSGSTGAANEILAGLHHAGDLDDETLGVLARTYKDLGLATDGEKRRRYLGSALDLYALAFARSGSYWTGINVATLAALLGRAAESADAARHVLAASEAALGTFSAEDPERYWALATVGEAALVLGDWAGAEQAYRRAFDAGRRRFGDLNSTRRQAMLLLAHHGRNPHAVDAWLPPPRVVLFSGHMIDEADRSEPRFPPRLEHETARSIRDWLSAHNGLIGVSSAACGADLLFLEALHALGGEAHIVLPYQQQDFIADSVAVRDAGDWTARFQREIARANVVYASASRPLDAGLGHDYTNQLIHGLAMLRARELDAEPLALAVWDGRAGDGPGGTSAAVQQWQRHGVPVHLIPLRSAGSREAEVQPAELLPARPAIHIAGEDDAAANRDDRILALLFADAVGFSRLEDREVPLFVKHCLGMVARLLESGDAGVVVRETWGDAFFLAFDSPRDAGCFALRMLEAMRGTDWQALGFSRSLTLRLALHAGPVGLTTDPVTGLPRCCGTHVSRAARLEPKTPPGQVYASEAFAALAALAEVKEFRCDYVRQLDWAKRYGTFPAYLVRPATAD